MWWWGDSVMEVVDDDDQVGSSACRPPFASMSPLVEGSPLALSFAELGPSPSARSAMHSLNSLKWPRMDQDKSRMKNGTWPSTGGFHGRSMAASVAALDAWPLNDDSGYSFAHYLWVVLWPCVAWIGQSLSGSASGPWHARLQYSCQLLQHDFVGFDDEGHEMDVQELAAFLATLIDAHLQVNVPVASLSTVVLSLLRCGLPAVTMSAYLVLMSSEVMSPLIG